MHDHEQRERPDSDLTDLTSAHEHSPETHSNRDAVGHSRRRIRGSSSSPLHLASRVAARARKPAPPSTRRGPRVPSLAAMQVPPIVPRPGDTELIAPPTVRHATPPRGHPSPRALRRRPAARGGWEPGVHFKTTRTRPTTIVTMSELDSTAGLDGRSISTSGTLLIVQAGYTARSLHRFPRRVTGASRAPGRRSRPR